MKLFTNKKLIPKITIVMVFLILFNFISPYCVSAESSIETAGKVIFTPVRAFFVICGDSVMNGLQYLFVTNKKAVIPASDQVEEDKKFLGDNSKSIYDYGLVKKIFGSTALEASGYWEDIPNFKYTPQSIFEGSIKSFKINFISGGSSTSNKDGENENDTNGAENNYKDETWYKSYVIAIDKLKQKAIDSYNSGNEEEALATLQIIQRLGCSILGVSDATKVENIQIPDVSNIKNTIRGLTNRFYNGQDIYGMLGFDEKKLTDHDKYGCQIIDSNNIVGILGVYHNEVGDEETSGETLDYDALAPVNALHDMIATWYKIMRNIALVFLLSILVYVGIRIMISSTAADTAKYKKMLVDWVVALCILFVLHYIMSFTNAAIDLVTSAFSTGSNQANWVDDVFGTVRLALQSDKLSDQFFYTLLYIVLVIYTGVFTIYYLKRVVYAAALTLMAPLVALTYPLDKIGDGKSQAFDMWLKEYIANAIIQPVHLLIYMVLISSVFTLAASNPLYAIVVMGAMIPTEKFVREMFGLNSKKGPGPAGGIAGGALAMNAFGKLMNRKPPIPHVDKNKSNSGNGSTEKEKKPRTQTTKDVNSSDYEAIIDEGDFGQRNENSIKDSKNPGANENEEIDNSQPRWNSNLSEEQRDELKAEGLEPGDAEYDQYLTGHGIKSNQDENNNQPESNQDENNNQPESNQNEDNNQPESNQDENNNQPKSKQTNTANTDNNKKENKKKIKPSEQAKRRAKATIKQYRRDKRKSQWKTVGKGALGLAKGATRIAGSIVGATAGVTLALGATVASGDVDKIIPNLATGVLAGSKGGKTLADVAIGTTGVLTAGAVNSVSSAIEDRKIYKDALMKEDKDYKKAKEKEKIHKKAHSNATKSQVNAYYGKLSKEERDAKLKRIEDYMDFGVKDTETIMKAMDLVDNNGFTENEAKMAAFQSERFEKDDDDGRNRVRRQMENAFLNASILNGDSSSEATRKSELQSDKLLQGIDRIHGVKEKEVGRPERELRRRQLAEENKKQLDREEAARLTAEAQRKVRQNNQPR